MLSYQDALKVILAVAEPLDPQTVPLDQVLGHCAAKKITATEQVPPFDNSAMDGYAVNSTTLTGATKETPVTLKVVGSTMAGDFPEPSDENAPSGAWEIMTGAPVPPGYDAVIRIEDTTILASNDQDRPTEISLIVEGFPGKNIRRAGTDFTPGDVLIDKAVRITPGHIMALAALGQDHISVTTPPKAAVISTGKELVDDGGQALRPGQIRNSNAPYLMNSLKTYGIAATNAGTIYDDPADFEQKIRRLLDQDVQIILSSGAVSMGRHDFVPDGLRAMGAEILFHKSAIRPGKPILFARFPNGTTYFGLPGNPIAAAVGLRFFAYPLIRKLCGLDPEQPTRAILKTDFSKDSPFRFFQKAVCHHDPSGQLVVEILPGQESFKIKPMLAQNCWAVVGEGDLSLTAGQPIDIYPLSPGITTGHLS
ncbi:MAG: molybdopterin molybdotransferase MoeA [Rhodobacteraceae bacterium]|nr:molybdopterin molybdotransferase MoeA [Paracoccaceae bacterium]